MTYPLPASTFESMIFPTSPNRMPSGPLEGIFIPPPQKKGLLVGGFNPFEKY